MKQKFGMQLCLSFTLLSSATVSFLSVALFRIRCPEKFIVPLESVSSQSQ